MYNCISAKKSQGLREWSILVVCVAAICSFILNSKQGGTAVYEGMMFVVRVIIPSIFPVMLISDLLARSGAPDRICSLLAPTMNKARLNPSILTPLIIGAVCGFPAGSKCVRRSAEQGLITSKEADCLLAASNCASPAFVISAIGVGMYSSALTGLTLWLVSFFTCVIISIILMPRQNEVKRKSAAFSSDRSVSFAELFCESVKSTSISILNIFFLITFFYSLSKAAVYILDAYGVSRIYSSLLCSMLEIGSGCSSAFSLQEPYSLCITAFSVGFGGLCVFFQVKNEAHRNADMRVYLTVKVVCGVISTLFAYFLLQS